MAIALLRWRGVILIRRRLRQALDRGASWHALSGLSSGWSIWRDHVSLLQPSCAGIFSTTFFYIWRNPRVLPCGGIRNPRREPSLATRLTRRSIIFFVDDYERHSTNLPKSVGTIRGGFFFCGAEEKLSVPSSAFLHELCCRLLLLKVQLAKERQASLLSSSVVTATGQVPSNLSPTLGREMFDLDSQSNPAREASCDDLKFLVPKEQQYFPKNSVDMSDAGESGSNRGLLDLLVDVCAAPPPYPLGSGVQSLGHDACKAAVRAFNLLSASLFEVVGSNPETVAVRVSNVQRAECRDDLPATVATDVGLPERERLGEGTVGVAAQSARPVCVEVAPSSSTGSGLDGPMSTWSNTSSTVLCVPVMLQAASVPNSQAGTDCDSSVNAGGMDSEGSPQLSPGVEVMGVLRAVRAGAGGFAGDDARVLSAFCGQLALAMVAERTLRDRLAGAEAKAAKEARAVRRHACRRVGALFAEGAVARALLRRPSHGVLEETEKGPRQMRRVAEELWQSVAGLAAGALGCERVDLLRVASLAGGGASSSGGPLPEFLSQGPTSRSFRRRSREALLTAKASLRSVPSSRDGEGGGVSVGEASSLLCVPVLGAGGHSSDSVVDAGDGTRQRQESSAMVCCAINKESAQKFDDVDEVNFSEGVVWGYLVLF